MMPTATILIIEDEPGFRRTYVDLFGHYGYKVEEAATGAEGLKLIKKSRPELVLLDLVMPDMDGFEVLRRIRQDPRLQKLPVIIFSVLGEQTDIQRALDMGANDYIIKGFYSPPEILKKLGSYLAQAEIKYEQKKKSA